MLGGGIDHEGGIVRPTIARLGRQKRPFDMPAGDGVPQLSRLTPQCSEAPQTLQHSTPVLCHEGQEVTTATGGSETARGQEQFRQRHSVLLKVDPAIAVDLEVEQRRGDPTVWRARLLQHPHRANLPVTPSHTYGLSGPEMPRADIAVTHGSLLIDCGSWVALEPGSAGILAGAKAG